MIFDIEIETDLGVESVKTLGFSASQLVTGGLGWHKRKPCRAWHFSVSQWRLLRRKSFSSLSLALSILLRQCNKRNYYTMMLSHTVLSSKKCTIWNLEWIEVSFWGVRKHCVIKHDFRLSHEAKFKFLKEKKKMFSLIIIMMSGARLTSEAAEEQSHWKMMQKAFYSSFDAEQFRIHSNSNWAMSKTSFYTFLFSFMRIKWIVQ